MRITYRNNSTRGAHANAGRRLAEVLWKVGLGLTAAFLLASCDGTQEAPTPPSSAPAPTAPESASDRAPAAETETTEAAAPPSRPRHERPLPAFAGQTLDGENLSVSSFIGKRLVLFFFNPEMDTAKPVARAVADVAKDRLDHNFDILGIAIGSDFATTQRFAKEMNLDFPIIDDSRGQIFRQLGLRSPVVLLGIDPEGYLSELAMGNFAGIENEDWEETAIEIRKKMRIPTSDESSKGELNQRPLAPLFETPRLDGGEPFRLADMEGRPYILIFFLHTCPHCHAALEFLKQELAKIPEDKRPELIGISLAASASRAAVHTSLDELGLDYFPILVDPSRDVQKQYGAAGGVPIIFVVDASGRIVQRLQGWTEGRSTALLRMQLARIAGTPIPMLLNPKGYTGSDACGVCHSAEYDSWLYTNHAGAYATLVEHGKERDPECVGCHVVGFDKPGGFTIKDHPRHLEDVGCESCHGRGGPHLSPTFAQGGDYEPVCTGCHNPKHSLGFEYATFLPKVSHAAVAALTPEERAEMFASRGQPRDVLPKGADFVGSLACKSCHSAEFETWSSQPHARAGATLQEAGKADDINCLRCHTTGYDDPGGFPAEGSLREHPDLASVGCESCHGPGGLHIAPDAKKVGTIVSLGDKCDSCVILQICGSCHDDANDPGFEFEVEEKIERQRHGTIEPGTGLPLEKSTHHVPFPGDSLHAVFFSALRDPDSGHPLGGS